MDSMLIIWLVMLVAFVVIEAVTVQLITVWFALGALASIIANLAGAQPWLQFAIFIVVAVVSLFATRPFVKKRLLKKIQPTNADMCIGEEAIVVQKIDNVLGSGQVKIKGTVWTARSLSNDVIEEGQKVVIVSIEGVKVIVKPI